MGLDEPLSDCKFCKQKPLIRPNLIGRAYQKSTRGIRQILLEICQIRELYKLTAILTLFHYNRHINLAFNKTSNCVQKGLDQQSMCLEKWAIAGTLSLTHLLSWPGPCAQDPSFPQTTRLKLMMGLKPRHAMGLTVCRRVWANKTCAWRNGPSQVHFHSLTYWVDRGHARKTLASPKRLVWSSWWAWSQGMQWG